MLYGLDEVVVADEIIILINTVNERAKVSILFTWANSIGGISSLSGDHVNEPFVGEDGVSGMLLHHKAVKMPNLLVFLIAIVCLSSLAIQAFAGVNKFKYETVI